MSFYTGEAQDARYERLRQKPDESYAQWSERIEREQDAWSAGWAVLKTLGVEAAREKYMTFAQTNAFIAAVVKDSR